MNARFKCDLRYVKKPMRCPARPRYHSSAYLSVATVKTHVSRLLDKLGCRDRAQLVVVAYETGVAIPGRRLR